MKSLSRLWAFSVLVAATLMAGCGGVRPIPDPRNPAPVRDSPQLLRVCVVNGDGPHLAVGDQVELTTSGNGRLTIRHLPRQDNTGGAWNGGEPIKVRAAVLVEMTPPRDNQKNTRRFVPVGRFTVRIGDIEHAPFDFSTVKATQRITGSPFAECNVDIGTDGLVIRGVDDDDRHEGDAYLY